MTKEQEEKLNYLLEIVPTAIIAARESTTPSFSSIMREFTSRMESMERKLDEHMCKTQPVVDALETAVRLRKATIWTAGFIVALSPIIATFVYIKEFVKK